MSVVRETLEQAEKLEARKLESVRRAPDELRPPAIRRCDSDASDGAVGAPRKRS